MSDREKPECYGDYEEYDPVTRVCEECEYINGCGIRATRNKNEDRGESRSTSRSYRAPTQTSRGRSAIDKYRQSKAKSSVVTEAPEESDTFIDILKHNASLEAVQAVFDEVANSVRHIPRKTYTSFKRSKK